ncbi:MAG: SIS domain-containing protein, partial [Verrucomicrobiota bacterium]
SRLEAAGHRFESDTDTEVLARLIGDRYRGDLRKAVVEALGDVEGAYGIAVLCAETPGSMVVARKGSPLSIGVAEDRVLVASDPAALVAHTRQVIHLDDGDVALRAAGSVDISGPDLSPRHRSPGQLPEDVAVAEKDGHEHFMHKEMHEQPESVRNALRGRVDLANGDSVLAGLGRGNDGEDAAVRRAVLLGCGTSLHACMVGEFAFEELAQLPAEAEQAAEFRYRNPLVGPEDLVIAVSQSGETADTLAAVNEARNRGARVRGLVHVVGAAIARQTGRGVYLHVGPEVSVASTKAFTGQVSVLLLMALRLGRARRLSRERGREIAREIDRIPSMIERVLELESAAIRTAERMVESEHAFFLGRGPMHPVALEGALKLKEISYV